MAADMTEKDNHIRQLVKLGHGISAILLEISKRLNRVSTAMGEVMKVQLRTAKILSNKVVPI